MLPSPPPPPTSSSPPDLPPDWGGSHLNKDYDDHVDHDDDCDVYEYDVDDEEDGNRETY